MTNSFKLDPSRAIHSLSDIFVIKFSKNSPLGYWIVHCVFVFLMDEFVGAPQILAQLGTRLQHMDNIATLLWNIQYCYELKTINVDV